MISYNYFNRRTPPHTYHWRVGASKAHATAQLYSSLAMVRRYAQIAQMDCARVHAKASPVDNWKL